MLNPQAQSRCGATQSHLPRGWTKRLVVSHTHVEIPRYLWSPTNLFVFLFKQTCIGCVMCINDKLLCRMKSHVDALDFVTQVVQAGKSFEMTSLCSRSKYQTTYRHIEFWANNSPSYSYGRNFIKTTTLTPGQQPAPQRANNYTKMRRKKIRNECKRLSSISL